MNKSFIFCNNCGKSGHHFHACKYPITSIGMITFRKMNDNLQYLMIKRKHTLGFVEFMRGKYKLYNYHYLLNIFNEMSNFEKEKLKSCSFEDLWNYLWGENIGIQYRCEKRISKEKYDALRIGIESKYCCYDLDSLIDSSNTKWNEPEWGFPKGRRNFQEKDLNCALREFEEETGYLKSNIKLVQNIIPYEEIFTGSNMKSYKHKYFLGHIDRLVEPTNIFQEAEVSEVKWLNYTECIERIRPYNLEKINILDKVNKVLQQYRLY
jgi:8-oxo-dGTP pyrophosphatase MutT (NUDIX family)